MLAPSHPGYGHSPEAASIDTVDDLAYLYLDLLAQQEARDAVVIGASLGGWIAAEMAVKSTTGLGRLILVAPLGIKVGDRETRDIPDIFALHPDEVLKLQYYDPARARLDPTTLSDDRLTVIARNREATALYGWEPYFHNPKLRGRLHRDHGADAVALGRGGSLRQRRLLRRGVPRRHPGRPARDDRRGRALSAPRAAGRVVERIGAFITN